MICVMGVHDIFNAQKNEEVNTKYKSTRRENATKIMTTNLPMTGPAPSNAESSADDAVRSGFQSIDLSNASDLVQSDPDSQYRSTGRK